MYCTYIHVHIHYMNVYNNLKYLILCKVIITITPHGYNHVFLLQGGRTVVTHSNLGHQRCFNIIYYMVRPQAALNTCIEVQHCFEFCRCLLLPLVSSLKQHLSTHLSFDILCLFLSWKVKRKVTKSRTKNGQKN